MSGICTIFQVIYNVDDRRIIVSVGVGPQGGISEED